MVDQVNAVNGMDGARPTRRLMSTYKISGHLAPADSVEISPDVMRLKGIEGVRMEKVMAIRSLIEDGIYFTPDKLDKALDAALDQIRLGK